MDVYEAAVSRRAIRRFKDIALPYDVLEKCVDAARLAPSGQNRQLYEYIIIDDEQVATRSLNGKETHVIQVPQDKQRGYSIQFEMTGVGVVHELEYEVGRRQSG